MDNYQIVKIWGGLGNQMFQYAFGRALEHELQTKVLYDVTSHYSKNENNKRLFNLDIFNLDINIASQDSINHILGQNIIHKLIHKNIVKQKHFYEFDKKIFNNKYKYFDGFWQNEKYFSNIKDIIIKEFTFPEIIQDYNKHYKNLIQKAEQPCFIHIRRSDYAEKDRLNINYYKKGVEYIKKCIQNPTLFVFGAECPDYIEKEFDIGSDFIFCGKENTSPENNYVDMQLMSLCKHGIIANSTYSWWGGYLINNPNKIIVAPSPWTRKGVTELIPNNYIQICNKFN